MKIINYPEIVRNLRNKHEQFFQKYSLYVEKNISERLFERGVTLARLSLIAKAFLEAGVITQYKEVDIMGHSGSIAMLPKFSHESFYLLNDCTDIVAVAGGVASSDAISGRIVLIRGESGSARSTLFRRYNDVLNDMFNWDAFAQDILEAIHLSIYAKDDAQKDFLTKDLFKNE